MQAPGRIRDDAPVIPHPAGWRRASGLSGLFPARHRIAEGGAGCEFQITPGLHGSAADDFTGAPTSCPYLNTHVIPAAPSLKRWCVDLPPRPSVRRATGPGCKRSCRPSLPSWVPRLPARNCRGHAKAAAILTVLGPASSARTDGKARMTRLLVVFLITLIQGCTTSASNIFLADGAKGYQIR